MNLLIKSALCAVLLAAVCLVPARLLAVNTSAVSPKAAAEAQAPATEANAIPHDMESGKHLLQWGVFLYAAGEVAALIGMGICNIRREKRRELQGQQKRIAADAGALLLYSEYKQALKSGTAA